MMKWAIGIIITGLGLVLVIQTCSTVQQDSSGAAGDFAERSTRSAELYRKCVDEKDKAACEELEQMNKP